MHLFTPTKKTDDEVRAWLHNELMRSIDPELAEENRKQTVEMMTTLDQEGLQKKLKQFEESLVEFLTQWPSFLRQKIKEMKHDVKTFKKMGKEAEQSAVQKLEEDIFSLDG